MATESQRHGEGAQPRSRKQTTKDTKDTKNTKDMKTVHWAVRHVIIASSRYNAASTPIGFDALGASVSRWLTDRRVKAG